jgi:peptidoglycan DL-endopeptidase LytE
MKYFKITLLLFYISSTVFSQENYIKHTIKQGDNITGIAAQYNVKPSDIYKLNPKAKGILKLYSVLQIPTSDKVVVQNSSYKKEKVSKRQLTHKVLPKETLYGISKEYGVSIDDIKNANPIIEKEGVDIGLQLIIPEGEHQKRDDEITEVTLQEKTFSPLGEEPVFRTVLSKETKYGIAREYGITVEELERQNPEIVNGLPVGYRLSLQSPKIETLQSPAIAVVNDANLAVNNDQTNIVSTQVIVAETSMVDSPVTIMPETETVEKAVVSSNMLDKLVVSASDNIGVRYRMGGTSRSGFDCSGLMITAFNAIDVKLPRTSREQSNYGFRVDPTQAQKGDLIFFSTNRSGHINHVGMVVDATSDEIKFIHASVHSGVVVSSTKESYYSRCFVKVNRVLQASVE